MTAFHIAWAMRTRSTAGNARLLLLVMADAADDAGTVRVPEADLAARCNCHRATLARALAALRGVALIEDHPEGLRLVTDAAPLFAVSNVQFAEPPPEPKSAPYKANSTPGSGDTSEAPVAHQRPEKTFSGAPEWMPDENTDLGRVLRAAQVRPDPTAPLYWFRTQHLETLRRVAVDEGMTIEDICSALQESPPQPDARSVAALVKAAAARWRMHR